MLCGAICGALHCYAGYAVLCGALLLILGVYVESLYASLNTANILVYETIFLGSNDFCKPMFVL